MAAVARVVLTGFSGTGKSTVAALLAQRLGWRTVDMDQEIELQAGMSIPAIFRGHGEAEFRQREREALRDAVGQDAVVVATGGGASASEAAWSDDLLRAPGTLVVSLEADPETIVARLRAQQAAQGETAERPMLAGEDPVARIRALKAGRQAYYDQADLTLVVKNVTPEDVAGEIAQVVALQGGQPLQIRLQADSADSLIRIRSGALDDAGMWLRERWPKARRAWIVTDANVAPHHLSRTTSVLECSGFAVASHVVAAGESSKSLATSAELYDWMLGGGIERGDVVVALGGGVVGDLAGYVAATVLRGVGLVQVPTTLLSAVDSSVGGKTGINHPAGKNLIGAFLQPPLVIIDPDLLRTAPPRELRSGWGEVIKHAFIQRSTPGGARNDLLTFLERNAANLLALAEPAISYAIWRNVALKAAVVQEDEREAGIRAYLNFGHTLGHAIEAADYHLLHGEAIAVGMCAAAALGAGVGTCSQDVGERVRALLRVAELPEETSVDEARVLSLLLSDKKRVAGRQRYILPLDGGGVVMRDDIPEDAVLVALRSVNRAIAVA
ncbi:MAG: 3-dehydroquinate synthase [Chloroflexota bacterium]|nr:3-dehydroquinate synthase [Chloroflexota bacterium]